MIRAFLGVQSVGAASQPVFGTTLNGAGAMLLDQHTLNTSPGSQDSQTVLPVTSTVGFRKGDRVTVGPKANFVFAGFQDQGAIFAINPGVSITVQGLLIPHATGEYLLLDEDVAQVRILPIVGNVGAIYLGNASTVAAADPSVFDVIAPPAAATQPTYWHETPTVGSGAIYKTSEYWLAGTAADKFVARIVVP